MRARSRRGANTVEFALIATLVVLLAGAGMELPWAMFQQARLRGEVRLAARAAAAVPLASDPAGAFTARFPDDRAEATLSGAPGDRVLTVAVTRAPRTLFGAGLLGVVGLDDLRAAQSVRLEDQRPEAP